MLSNRIQARCPKPQAKQPGLADGNYLAKRSGRLAGERSSLRMISINAKPCSMTVELCSTRVSLLRHDPTASRISKPMG